MNRTPKLNRVIADAEKNGATVTEDDGRLVIRMGKTSRSRGLVVSPDGLGFDATVDHAVAKALRTEREWRAVLGLKG